jgi:hypothetical protein
VESIVDRFLLFRPDDQLLLGVAWSGLSFAGRDPTGAPVLEAGAGATVVLTLPPQHVGEQVSPAGPSGAPALPPPDDHGVLVWRAALAGPSRIAFALDAGVRLTPTVAGILELIAGLAVLPSVDPAGPEQTAIELPWRFAVSPGPGSVAAHAAHPVTAADVSALWRTRIVAASTDPAAGLRLVPVDRGLAESDDPFPVPLHRELRTRLYREAVGSPARADRLELSPIGGTLRASGAWPGVRWDHEAVLGRDMRVETVLGGVLFPLGHRAVYTELVQRVVSAEAGNASVLCGTHVLAVPVPLRATPGRGFPFDTVVLEESAYADLGPVVWQRYPFGGAEVDTYFRPLGTDGTPLLFPVRCTAGDDVVRMRLPLIFVADLLPGADSLADAGLAERLSTVYGGAPVPLPGVSLDLARSAEPRDGDRHEVHELTVNGDLVGGEYRPRLQALSVALPALRVLLGDDERRAVQYTEQFLTNGDGEDVLLRLVDGAGSINVGFNQHAERSGGLAVPQYAANALSRRFGPVNLGALPDAAGLVPSRALLGSAASLFGYPLLDLIEGRMPQPQIVSLPRPGGTPAIAMNWRDVRLQAHGPFVFDPLSALSITVSQSGEGIATTCTLENFALLLPLDRPQLRLRFASVTFTQEGSAPPRLELRGLAADFLNELRLLEELGDNVDLAGAGLALTASPTQITAAYRLPLAEVSAGAFVLRGIVFRAGVTVPFDGRPVSVSLGFASREAPFTLTVLMFGGGGYIDVELDHTGLRRLEAALEFGALVAVDFVVARAEVHALGGARYVLAADGSVSLGGYLRIGGCVDILGLVSVSLELCVSLSYQSDTKALVGRATLVIEIDLTLWSQSVELDTGEWVLAGGGAPTRMRYAAAGAPPALDDGLPRWRAYRAAFAGSEQR